MSKRAEYLAQAEECKNWADKAGTTDRRARWLELAGKWLRLAEEYTEPAEGFRPVIYKGGGDRKTS